MGGFLLHFRLEFTCAPTLHLIERGQNYGWPLVSNGDEYSGAPIPRNGDRARLSFHETRRKLNCLVVTAAPASFSGAGRSNCDDALHDYRNPTNDRHW